MKKGLLFLTSLMLCLLVVSTSCSGNMDDKVDVTPPEVIKKAQVHLNYEGWRIGNLTFLLTSPDLSVSQYLPKSPSALPDVNVWLPIGSKINIVIDYSGVEQKDIPDEMYYRVGDREIVYKAALLNTTNPKQLAFEYTVIEGDNLISLMPARSLKLTTSLDMLNYKITSDVGDTLSDGGYIDVFQHLDVEFSELPLNIGKEPGNQEIILTYNGESDGFYNSKCSIYINPFEYSGELTGVIKPIREISIIADAEFTLICNLYDKSVDVNAASQKKQIAIPYGQTIKLKVADRHDQVSNVFWNGIEGDKNGTEITYDQTTDIKEIRADIICSDSVLYINEPSFASWVSVSLDGKEIEGTWDNGYTLYKVPYNSKLLLKSKDPIDMKFLNWGEKNGAEDPMTLPLETAIKKIKPTFISNVTEDNILYVAPNGNDLSIRESVKPNREKLGTEANPFPSIPKALEYVDNGYELRLFEGVHVVDGSLDIEKSINITGGWHPGRPRADFRYTDDGIGAPKNLATHIKFRGTIAKTSSGEKNLINIKAPEGAKVRIDGISIREYMNPAQTEMDENTMITGGFDHVIRTYGTDFTFTNSEIMVQIKASSKMPNIAVWSSAPLDVDNSTIEIYDIVDRPRASIVHAIKVDVMEHLSVESSRIIAGNQYNLGSVGILSQTATYDSIVKNCIIDAVSQCSSIAVEITNGKVMNSDLYASSFQYAGMPTTCVNHGNGGDIVIDNNRMLLQIANTADTHEFAAIIHKIGNIFISNNSIYVDCIDGVASGVLVDGSKNVYPARAIMIGNYILAESKSNKNSDFAPSANSITGLKANVLLMNNTFEVAADSVDGGKNTTSSTIKLKNDSEDTLSLVLLNNVHFGEKENHFGVMKGVDITGKYDICMDHDAYFDLSDSLVTFDGTKYTTIQDTLAAFKAHDAKGCTRVLGESVGETKPYWDNSAYRLETDHMIKLNSSAPQELKTAGLYMTDTELKHMFISYGFKLPLVEFPFDNAYYTDMNGNSRIVSNNMLGIGAVRY